MPTKAPTFRPPGWSPKTRRQIDYEYGRHRRKHPDAKFLQTRDWRDRIRPAQLMREPTCRHCRKKGVTTLAVEVDHIIVPNGDTTLQRDPENLQSLCKTCHSVKTRADGRGHQKSRA